jgi:hypothetical protein
MCALVRLVAGHLIPADEAGWDSKIKFSLAL